jgi:hypothetical protein
MQGDENKCSELWKKGKSMELCKLYGEFETVDLAELAEGRIRRSVSGVQHTEVQKTGHSVPLHGNSRRFTMLPANMRMMNYVTAVMVSDMSDSVIPEPFYRSTAQLLVICSRESEGRVAALMQAAGAVSIRKIR